MASKMTFTLDDETAARIDRTVRLGMSKSGVVRQAVREYAARTGMLSDEERRRMLEVFDEMTARIPRRPTAEVDREIKALRAARRTGRRTPTDRP
jgi:Arc/MetJ-type ribon-helix-helix transcriptional regulator